MRRFVAFVYSSTLGVMVGYGAALCWLEIPSFWCGVMLATGVVFWWVELLRILMRRGRQFRADQRRNAAAALDLVFREKRP